MRAPLFENLQLVEVKLFSFGGIFVFVTGILLCDRSAFAIRAASFVEVGRFWIAHRRWVVKLVIARVALVHLIFPNLLTFARVRCAPP